MKDVRLTIGTGADGKKFTLPLDFVTQTAAILARKRVGKTYTASVIAEEFAEEGIPFVVLDPTGAWWGLRSHYPVVILGGGHGDVPLEPTAGKVIADLVTEQPGFYIIDLSQTVSNAEQDRFAADFAERLYRAKEKHRFPLHLFVDEADAFAPQRPFPGQQRMLGAFEAIVRRGGIRGLGMTLITQRPAVLNKSVLTQAEMLVVLQMTGPQDQDAVDDWVKRNGTKEQRDTMMASLASLQVGEAWVWSPSWLQCFEQIKVRARRTFNSSATPKAGEKIVTPELSAIDLAKLGKQIADTVERAKENDPKELRAEIARLKAEAGRKTPAPPPPPAEKVPLLTTEQDERLKWLEQQFDAIGNQLVTVAKDIVAVRSMQATWAKRGERATWAHMPGGKTYPVNDAARRVFTQASSPSNGSLPKAERAILTCLAQFGACSKAKVAAITGYAVTGGGFNNALGALRSSGYINSGEPIEITETEGLAALGKYDPLPTGQAMIDQWLRELPKAESLILRTLCEAYPRSVEKEVLAEVTGYEVTGGGYNNALGRLRTLELITRGAEIRANDNLFSQ